jgi:hypothetical protein
MSSVCPGLVCVFFAVGGGHCYSLLLFATFGLVNVPGSCNVGSNDAYLSDSPYSCSGPSFSQSVKQKTNDVLPVFFSGTGNCAISWPSCFLANAFSRPSEGLQEMEVLRYRRAYCWTRGFYFGTLVHQIAMLHFLSPSFVLNRRALIQRC